MSAFLTHHFNTHSKTFLDVLLVCAENLVGEIKEFLAGPQFPALDRLCIEIIPLSSSAENWGTADVLRHIEMKIKVC